MDSDYGSGTRAERRFSQCDTSCTVDCGHCKGQFCKHSLRVDGPLHSWQFDGDDPYIFCAYCGELRDAHTGRVLA